MTASSVDAGATAQVLEEIRHELVDLLGDGLDPDAIRVDVDVFAGDEPVIADRWLDSMDLVQIMAALEDRFDVRLATVLTGDDPLTLANVARYIAGSRP
jgi:acyl carrier protein